MMHIVFNGKFVKAGSAVVRSDARGLRFGDGCFETMKAVNGHIILKDLHFGRLFATLELLFFEVTEDFPALLEQQVVSLLQRNGHAHHARVRVTVFRGPGGLGDVGGNEVNYVIETNPLDPVSFNTEGLVVDVYKESRKQCDHFSHIKSNNFLPYIMAARWMKSNDLDDAIVLNSNNRVADTTIANVFIVQNGVIKTPVLSEGCIAGVMRKFLVNSCRKEGIPVEETVIAAEDLQSASEVFLTNSIRGIRWVKEIAGNSYSCQVSKLLYDKMVRPLWR